MSTHFSLRLPSDLLKKIQDEAAALDRSVSWVIADRLRVSYETYFQIVPRRVNPRFPIEKSVEDPVIVDLYPRKARGRSMRPESTNVPRGTDTGVPLKQARRFDTNFSAIGCKSCGGLNGLHQKGCKA